MKLSGRMTPGNSIICEVQPEEAQPASQTYSYVHENPFTGVND